MNLIKDPNTSKIFSESIKIAPKSPQGSQRLKPGLDSGHTERKGVPRSPVTEKRSGEAAKQGQSKKDLTGVEGKKLQDEMKPKDKDKFSDASPGKVLYDRDSSTGIKFDDDLNVVLHESPNSISNHRI